jgi:GTP-binding protein
MKSLPVRFVKGVTTLRGLPKARVPEIAVCGRSNVGKSSCLNTLFARKGIAKVSRTPGRTREINFYSIADRFHLVDLPGYGYARVPHAVRKKWGELMRAYLETREQLAGVLALVDLRHGPTALDEEMLEWLIGAGRTALVVATKADKLKRSVRSAARRKLSAWEERGVSIVEFSALTREGRKPVLEWIDRKVADWNEGRAEGSG